MKAEAKTISGYTQPKTTILTRKNRVYFDIQVVYIARKYFINTTVCLRGKRDGIPLTAYCTIKNAEIDQKSSKYMSYYCCYQHPCYYTIIICVRVIGHTLQSLGLPS